MSNLTYSKMDRTEHYDSVDSYAVSATKRAKQEETQDVDMDFSPSRGERKSGWAEFSEDFGFNMVHYVLVPASGVVLFAAYVYAQVVGSTGY